MGKKINCMYYIDWSLLAMTVLAVEVPNNDIISSTSSLPADETRDALSKTDDRDNTSSHTREKLDQQYLDYFEGKMIKPEVPLTHWRALRLLEQHNEMELGAMCRAAFKILHAIDISIFNDSETTHKSMIFTTHRTKLLIGPKPEENKLEKTYILVCITLDAEQFFLTKGRRPNSVYFIKPTKIDDDGLPANFVLDERFPDGDVDLPYDFNREALSILQKKFPQEENPWL